MLSDIIFNSIDRKMAHENHRLIKDVSNAL